MLKIKLLKLFVFLILILLFQTNTRADIFDGGSGGGGNIFDGIRQGFEGIFDGIRGVFPGGASIPGVPPPTATPTPDPLISPTPTPPGMVPPRNEGKNLKLTLEWDTQSLGGESVYPETEDPLKCIHLGKLEPGCGSTNYPGMIFCPCASTPGGRATRLRLDNQNRLVLANDQSSDQQVDASEVPQPPQPAGPGGPPLPPAPIVWVVCVNDTKCMIGSLSHVLTGWCGHNPVILDSGAYNQIGSKVPPQTAGPNSFTLPNAVSNKFIRRDGYFYQCVTDCAGTQCIQDNYVEFQTMIYPSNAVSMSLNVENPGTQKVENIMIKINTATNAPSGETPLPHNIDVLAKIDGTPFASPLMDNTYYTNPYVTSATNAVGGWGYVHGDEINENTQITWEFNSTIPQTVKKVVDPNEANRFIYQFQIGAFDLNPGEKKVLDFQPQVSEFSKIPSTQNTYPSQDLNLVPAAKPCECQSVKIHDALGVDAGGCEKAQTKPTLAMCLLYYGVGIRLRSNPADPNSATDYRSHSGGYSCDLQGIPVEGCPPPWCFADAVSTVGPFDKCPDWNGDGFHTEADRIPNPNVSNPDGTPKANPETHDTVHWFERSEWWTNPANAKYQESYITSDAQSTDFVQTEKPSIITSIVNAIIPRKVLEFTGLRPVEVSAFGCTHPCKNVPPPGLLGLGRMIPRDYNFVCSPTDLYTPTDVTSMVEKERCDGSDYGIDKTIIPPSDVNTFKTYRDVTGLRGCGYNASSNNSVIGPIQVMAEYSGTNDNNRTGRSVLLASIPVGGRLVDDQSRPYGWPVTGEIEQDWGYIGEATNRGPYRSQPWYDYNEYRYCSAMDIINPQDPGTSGVNCNAAAIITDDSKNNVKPLAQLITDLTNSNVHNWIADLTHWSQTPNSTINNLTKCYNDVINRAIISGNDPAYVMATWLEESAASNYDSFPDVSDFGCISLTHSNFNSQITCMTGLQRSYTIDSTFATCRDREVTGDPMDGKMNVDKFQQLFSGGSTECVNKTHVANANFYSKIRYTYSIVHKNASVLKNCVLMTDDWSSATCTALPTLP